MKTEIKEVKQPKSFVPGSITITFETEEELSLLWNLFNQNQNYLSEKRLTNTPSFYYDDKNTFSFTEIIWRKLQNYVVKHKVW